MSGMVVFPSLEPKDEKPEAKLLTFRRMIVCLKYKHSLIFTISGLADAEDGKDETVGNKD